jgi:hypothetical protein
MVSVGESGIGDKICLEVFWRKVTMRVKADGVDAEFFGVDPRK